MEGKSRDKDCLSNSSYLTNGTNLIGAALDAYGKSQETSSIERSLPTSFHNILLLADSALPLGSFHYSSGLESYLAHHTPLSSGSPQLALVHRFIRLTIQSVASTSVPYLLAAFRDPDALSRLDNDFDASTPCNVARRASVAQGSALVIVWEKAFAKSLLVQSPQSQNAARALHTFARELRTASLSTEAIGANGHLAPLWGVTGLALEMDVWQTAFLFLLNHAKAVLGAAVQSSVVGTYQRWAILGGASLLDGTTLQHLLCQALDEVWEMKPEDAGQVVPAMDLWVGRHELLYSRIFNS